MLDITECPDGEDLVVLNSAVAKSGNVLSVQIGDLEYEPEFGVDKRFFLESEFQFQNESLKAYLVQRLTENQINVAQVLETIETFYQRLAFSVSAAGNTTGGFIT